MSAIPEGVSAPRQIRNGLRIPGRFAFGLDREFSWTSLFTRIDTASMAFVRIAIGLLVACDALRKGQSFFYPSDGVLPFTFKYQFFHWVQEAPELSVYLPYLLFISGVAVSIGLFFRFFCLLSLLLVMYGFLLQAENYLNHYYMLIITLFLLSISPAHRSFSIDRLLFFVKSDGHAPRIYLLLFKLQIEIILIYAGLVKINSDWLQLEPLRTWLLNYQDRIFFGSLWQNDVVTGIGAYGIIILHVLGAPLLFFRQTRLAVFGIYSIFHIINHFVFDIGIFPWMTIACTTLFFPADWPRRALGSLSSTRASASSTFTHFRIEPKSLGNQALVAFCVCWLLFQLLFPFRHVLYPGWVEWTNEGHRFAWRMKLTDKATTGVILAAYIPEQGTVRIPNLMSYMSKRQLIRVSRRPDLVQQLAWQVAEMYKKQLKVREVRIFAYLSISLNNREAALLIDPTVDLAATRPTIWHDHWLTETNPNPLRRIEEVRASGPHSIPSLQELLRSIGLPNSENCFMGNTSPGLHEAAVCSVHSSNDGIVSW